MHDLYSVWCDLKPNNNNNEQFKCFLFQVNEQVSDETAQQTQKLLCDKWNFFKGFLLHLICIFPWLFRVIGSKLYNIIIVDYYMKICFNILSLFSISHLQIFLLAICRFWLCIFLALGQRLSAIHCCFSAYIMTDIASNHLRQYFWLNSEG